MIDLQCHQGNGPTAQQTTLAQTNPREQQRSSSRCSSPGTSSSDNTAQHSSDSTMIPTTIKRERRLASSPIGPNLHQLHQRRSMSPPPLARHINLINQSMAAAAATTATTSPATTVTTSTTATKRPASPSGDRNDLERLQMHNHHHHHHHRTSLRRTTSPGYHSSAPSPNSSVASPVSSGVSSASGSFCSSSSVNSPPCQHQQMLTPISLASGSATTSPVALINSKSPASSTSLISPNSHFPAATAPTATMASLSASSSSSAYPRHVPSALGALNDPPHLLDYYPAANQDGLGLSWFHDANSRQSLSLALVSDKMIVAGDISLAEMSRYPVPIMARPPLTVSDLTLENWLQTVSGTHKGIKLNFTSTRTVEPAFRVLARHAKHLQGPLILSADILNRAVSSSSQQSAETGTQQNGKGRHNQAAACTPAAQSKQPVDAWTFLMLCRTRFPKSIISIGWCSIDNGGGTSDQMYKFDACQQLGATNRINSGALGQPKAQLANAQQADNCHSGSSPNSESMFELDLVMEHPALMDGALSQHIQLLAAASRQYRQQQQHHATNAFQDQSPAARQVANNLGQFGRHHHQLLSSNGSLNSSSGNSSGSPSPTSPIGHHIGSAQQQQLLSHHHLQQQQRQSPPDSTEQLILAAAVAEQQQQHRHDVVAAASKHQQWSTLANAMVSVAGSNLNQHHHHPLDFQRTKASHSQQLPLNLNINEADPQHTSATAGLGDLAHRIQQSIEQRQQGARLAHSHAPNHLDQAESLAAAVLANKLFNPTAGATTATIQNNAQLVGGANSNSWLQMDRKSVLEQKLSFGARAAPAANLLCVRTQQPNSTTGNQQARGQPAHEPSDSVGYTREMIDKMASLVKEYNLTQPVTFPVEARLLGKSVSSLNELQRLLHQVGLNSTLTIVAQKGDLIKVDDLLAIRKHFATNQILYDLPDELAAELRNELDNLL